MRNPGLPKLTNQNMEDAPQDTKWVESVKSVVNISVQSIEKIRSGEHGIKLLESCDVEQMEIDVQAPDPWSNVTLTGGAIPQVAPYSKSYYMKHPDGSVEYRLFADACVVGTAFFSFPTGYRPAKQLILAGTNGTGTHTSYTIATNGDVKPVVLGGGGDLSVSAIGRFSSLDATPVPLSCWPKTFLTKFDKVCAVVVAKAWDAETTTPLPPGLLSAPVWEYAAANGKSQVKLLNIAGLPYNRKSRVRLLVFGG